MEQERTREREGKNWSKRERLREEEMSSFVFPLECDNSTVNESALSLPLNYSGYYFDYIEYYSNYFEYYILSDLSSNLLVHHSRPIKRITPTPTD